MGAQGAPVLKAIGHGQAVVFRILIMIMWLAPVGAFGAIAAVVGATGFQAIVSMFTLMAAFYITCALFIVVILGGLLQVVAGVNIFKLMKYLAREYLLIFSTSSSEAALPRLIAKLEHLGVSKPVVGVTVPTGYSFNLDGTAIYLTMASLFVANAMGTPLDLGAQVSLLIFMIIASKGAAGVTGAGLATLAAGLQAHKPELLGGVGMIVGIDRFMSEARALTNFTGNAVATVLIGTWVKEIDGEQVEPRPVRRGALRRADHDRRPPRCRRRPRRSSPFRPTPRLRARRQPGSRCSGAQAPEPPAQAQPVRAVCMRPTGQPSTSTRRSRLKRRQMSSSVECRVGRCSLGWKKHGRWDSAAGIQRQRTITVIESVDRYVSSEQGSATLEGTELDLEDAVMGPTGRPHREFPEPAPLSSHGPARVIAMVNQKGGVGKTTSTINLAAALAEYGRRVLLVDFDPQGALSAGLGINPHELDLTVYNVLMDRKVDIRDAIHQTGVENVDLLPANIDLSAAEVQLVNEVAREQVLDRALKKVEDDYDVVLIDCQPSLGLLTVNALTAAHGVIIPLICEFFALRAVALLVETIDKVQDRLNPRLQVDGVLATMYDARTLHSREVISRLVEAFGDKVFETVIKRSIKFADATVAAEPITSYAGNHIGADAYRRLAKELISRGGAP